MRGAGVTFLSYFENISSSILVSGLAKVSIRQLMSTEERSEILTLTAENILIKIILMKYFTCLIDGGQGLANSYSGGSMR